MFVSRIVLLYGIVSMPLDIVQLNSSQKQAVTAGEGPVMIVAGAGTGKTTVIANRIAWLIAEKRAQPEEILAVTFTEKAAAEMEERVDRLLPLGYTDLWIHTFHGFCHRVLDEYGIDIGLPGGFKVLDATASWLLVKENLSRFNLDYYRPLGNPTRFIHALVNHFARCKDEGVHPEEYLAYAESLRLDSDQAADREAVGLEHVRITEVAESYHVYQQLLLENNALDFGDLIDYTVRLFRTRPAILELFRTRFRYVLVDEFQDTNWLQYELLKLLAAPRNNLMVVGDDDQSIYKFRGASFSNIILFKKEFPNATEIFLTDNYRSGQSILDVAYRFIQLNNPDRLEVKLSGKERTLSKRLSSHTGDSGECLVLRFESADDEVRGIIERILLIQKNDPEFSWSDVAILVRANETAQRFVRYLRALGLPHQFLAAKGLYSQDVIRAIISYLRLLDNYHEPDALYALLTIPVWGITGEDVISLTHLASKKSWSLWHTLTAYQGELKLAEASRTGIMRLQSLVSQHTDLKRTLDPTRLIYRFLEESGYLEFLTREDTSYTREQMLYLNQFYKKIRTWEEEHLGAGVAELTRYLALELESGDTGTLAQNIEEGPENITVSTIHSAKGLEYRFVFIVGLVHLRFPTRERRDPIELPKELIKDVLPEGDAHMQEERRLMYVALTRAKEKVFLTYAKDYGGATLKKPSSFLGELGVNFDVAVTPVTADLVMPTAGRGGERSLRYALPAKFSYTQLKAFEICPKQYYYAHIIRIPTAGRGTFTFGKTIHAVLQKFFELVRERSAHAQGQLFAVSTATTRNLTEYVSEGELLEIYNGLWSEDWFASPQEKETYRARGKKMLQQFYGTLAEAALVPVSLEQPFNVKIDDATLKGQIDRIDEVMRDGVARYRLIDYKTGKSPQGDTLTFGQKEQLLLYQVAAEEVLGKKVDSLVLYFLESGSQFSFVGSEKDIGRLKAWVGRTIEKIRHSDFAPTPGALVCNACDFKNICPAAQLR